MTTRDRVLALLVVLVWGMNFVAIDLGLQGVPPLVFVGLRFILVAFPALLFVPRPSSRFRDVLVLGTFISVGQFGLLYSSIALGMPPGLASLVLQAQAAFTVVLGIVVLREHPRPAQVAGVGLGLVGLAVIAGGRGGAVPGLALALCVAAALSWACGNIAARRCRGDSGLSLTVWSGLVVPVPMFALSLLVDGPQVVGHALTHLTAVNWLSTAYTAGLASLFGYAVWNGLLGRHRVAEVAPFTLLVPVVGMTTAALAQGERPSLLAVVGGALLVAGVALSLGGFPRRRSKTQVMEPS